MILILLMSNYLKLFISAIEIYFNPFYPNLLAAAYNIDCLSLVFGGKAIEFYLNFCTPYG